MYDNDKVNRVLSLLAAHGLDFTRQDFADLAIACADQAGLEERDQKLMRQLIESTIENAKHGREVRR